MTTETTAQKLYWLQRQIDGAITFLVITIFFVGLKLVATGVQTCKTKTAVGARSVVFAVAALIPFVPLAALTIGELVLKRLQGDETNPFLVVNAKAYKSFYQDSSIVEQEQYFTIIQKTFYGFSVLYPIACVLPKLSICFMYLRLFEVSIWVARTSKLLVVFLLLNTIAWLVPSVVVCQPIAVYWSPSGEEGRCIDINVFGTWISLPHIVSDLVMLVLPLPTLWKMQMRRAKKIGVIFTIVTGSL